MNWAHQALSKSRSASSGSSRKAEEIKQNVPNPLQYTAYGMQPDCTLILCSSSAAGVARKWKALHRFWECCENAKIESDAVIKSQNLCRQAKLHWDDRGACFWNGGISPHNLRASKPRRVSEAEARAKAEEDCIEALDRECLASTDGAGGAVGSRSERHIAVGAGTDVVTFGPNRKPTHVTCMCMKVQGKQTMPRAET